MKKLNKKGFTLIELLAVIVIMGILMMVAIPATQRYIANSRKDTYVSTVKEIVNTVRNADAAGYLKKKAGVTTGTNCITGTYYVEFDTAGTGAKAVLESGGKSPFTKTGIKGYVKINVGSDGKHTYEVVATDDTNGFATYTNVDNLSRGNVSDGASAFASFTKPADADLCEINN